MTVDKTVSKWRYATYRLPETITEEPEFKAEEEPNPEQQYKQVEEISDIELVPYIEGHAQLIRTERVISIGGISIPILIGMETFTFSILQSLLPLRIGNVNAKTGEDENDYTLIHKCSKARSNA